MFNFYHKVAADSLSYLNAKLSLAIFGKPELPPLPMATKEAMKEQEEILLEKEASEPVEKTQPVTEPTSNEEVDYSVFESPTIHRMKDSGFAQLSERLTSSNMHSSELDDLTEEQQIFLKDFAEEYSAITNCEEL